MTIESNLEKPEKIKEEIFDFLNSEINHNSPENYEDDEKELISSIKQKKISFDSTEVQNDSLITIPVRKVYSPDAHSSRNLEELNKKTEGLRTISHSNIIFQQLLSLISEQDINFQMIDNVHQIEDYIKSLDNTPVYLTFNCGVIYIPNKNKISEYDILTYTGQVSKQYIGFLSSLGKAFSLNSSQNIYAGGLDRTGSQGRYSIYFEDNIFQLVYHVSNLIKFEKKVDDNQLLTVRKKLLGNDYINIIWLENPYCDFDPNIIISSVILIYIVIYPISPSHYLIRMKQNKKSKFKVNYPLYFNEDMIVKVESIQGFIQKLIISLNIMISYSLQNSAFKKYDSESVGKGYQQILFDTNITQRYKELERINYRFKNSI
jgi:hypothetical protein